MCVRWGGRESTSTQLKYYILIHIFISSQFRMKSYLKTIFGLGLRWNKIIIKQLQITRCSGLITNSTPANQLNFNSITSSTTKLWATFGCNNKGTELAHWEHWESPGNQVSWIFIFEKKEQRRTQREGVVSGSKYSIFYADQKTYHDFFKKYILVYIFIFSNFRAFWPMREI